MARLLQFRFSAPLAAMFAALLLGFGPFAGTHPAHALTNCTVDSSVDSEEQAFLGLINNYRAQNGKAPLKLSTNLTRASAWMSKDMASKSYFSHTDKSGRDPSQRAKDCGYPGGAGENIAAGTVWDTAQEAFTAWKGSPGHNANMLNSSYKMIGIGRYYLSSAPYRWYWTTDFGLIDDGTGGSSGGTSGGGTSGGGTTGTTSAKAAMSSPAPGSTILHGSAAFRWTAGSGAQGYALYVGSRVGGYSYYHGSQTNSLAATVNNLPKDGRTVYVRLWTKINGSWQHTDYTYRTGP